MKKLLVLLIFVSLLNSCDDGNMEVQSFDFTAVSTNKCGAEADFFIYKITGNEALIIKVNEDVFENRVGTDSIEIPTNATLIYRVYDGPVTTATLCSTVPASTPKVVEEWTSTGGEMKIITNAVKTVVEATGSSRITGFNHTISLTDVTFNTGNGEQRNDVIPFGTYLTTPTNVVGTFGVELNRCDNNMIYSITNNQVLALSLDAATYADLFADVPTTVGSPKTALLNATNTMNVRIFSLAGLETVICGDPASLPTVIQRWNAEAGVANVSGIISVETTTNGSGFDHTVTLKNVIFQNPEDLLEFTFGTSYIFGKYTSN